MRVDVSAEDRRFRYRVALDDDERGEAIRTRTEFEKVHRFVGEEFVVELPPSFTHIHPDLHALGLYLFLSGFVGQRFALSFPVSATFAEAMARGRGVTLPNVDERIVPRARPAASRPGLLYSGGRDSSAACLVLPDNLAVVHLHRLPRPSGNAGMDAALVEFTAREQAICDTLARHGRDVHLLREDHEALWRPYPSRPGFDVVRVPAVYLADSLGLWIVEEGVILENATDTGYRYTETRSWTFAAPDASVADGTGLRRIDGPDAGGADVFDAVQLRPAGSSAGLSTICTSIIVNKSYLAGRACSCDVNMVDRSRALRYPPTDGSCMRCHRCFQKDLLDMALRGEEVPADMVDQFLSFPAVRNSLKGPFFEWHHIWWYTLQRVKCRHWWIEALQRQAKDGPDLSLFERWHPGFAERIPEEYRATVVTNIGRYVDTMTDADMRALAALSLPPLDVPPVPEDIGPPRAHVVPADLVAAPDQGAMDGEGATEGPPREPERREEPDVGDRPATIRVVFRDREKRLPDFTFLIAAVEAGDRYFRISGRTGLAHLPCPNGKAFELVSAVLSATIARLPGPPGVGDLERWRAAIAAVLTRSPVPKRFDWEATQGAGA